MKRNLVAIATFCVLIALFSFSVVGWRRGPAPVDPNDWCAAHKVALSLCES
jgi:hypothetical protein